MNNQVLLELNIWIIECYLKDNLTKSKKIDKTFKKMFNRQRKYYKSRWWKNEIE